jgi:hypothetical protein
MNYLLSTLIDTLVQDSNEM